MCDVVPGMSLGSIYRKFGQKVIAMVSLLWTLVLALIATWVAVQLMREQV